MHRYIAERRARLRGEGRADDALGPRPLPARLPRGAPAAFAAAAAVLAGLTLGLAPAAEAQGAPFNLAPAGCPMSHCDGRMSDAANIAGPTSGSVIAVDNVGAGAKGGLGCVSNTRLVACTKSGDPQVSPNLVVYNGDGVRLWTDGGLLGPGAWTSAALMAADGSVIAADQNRILRLDGSGQLVWQMAKPDAGSPISPVLVGKTSSMVLLATGGNEVGTVAQLSVWDATTGVLLDSTQLLDTSTGKTYHTRNTPAVSGSRAYVVTEADDNQDDGRLYAIDVCDSTNCGGRGKISQAWKFGFDGPSGASPLLIGSNVYFDGRPAQGGVLFSLADNGATATLNWSRTLPGAILANAAQDPRGGFWLYTANSDSLIRVSDRGRGATLQTVVVSSVLGLPAGYTPSSALTVSGPASGAGPVVLTFGVRPRVRGANYVGSIDVSSTTAGSALWKVQVGTDLGNFPAGQFPVVLGSNGKPRVAFEASTTGTYFVGAP